MALLTGYTGSSLNKFGRSITLALGDSAGVVATTISADATFDLTTATINAVNGGASNRNVTAVADVEVSGMVKVFKNTGTTNNLGPLATLVIACRSFLVSNGMFLYRWGLIVMLPEAIKIV